MGRRKAPELARLGGGTMAWSMVATSGYTPFSFLWRSPCFVLLRPTSLVSCVCVCMRARVCVCGSYVARGSGRALSGVDNSRYLAICFLLTVVWASKFVM